MSAEYAQAQQPNLGAGQLQLQLLSLRWDSKGSKACARLRNAGGQRRHSCTVRGVTWVVFGLLCADWLRLLRMAC